MLKTDKNYEFDVPPKESDLEYKIAPNDLLDFRLYTNDGFKLIDFTTSSTTNTSVSLKNGSLEYLVEFDGFCNLPILGRTKVTGLTLREAELMLEEKYAELYIDPFLLLNVTNRRVTIFPGSDGSGKVITLENNNTTLIEAIALAGGISQEGKAYRIKLIRGNLKDPQVYLIDLSTIEGLKYADIILQANDIIYIEPVGVTRRQIIAEIAPIVSLLLTSITLFVVINQQK
jgi:polysaccharide export outer membrane protein